MKKVEKLQQLLQKNFAAIITSQVLANEEITVEVPAEHLLCLCERLRDYSDLKFASLIDICGVDYLTYGVYDWKTQTATSTGFDRGVESPNGESRGTWEKPRFAVVYHLL